MKVKARAKINLALNVVGKMENGYHELEMIMVPLNFYDELTITFSKQTSVEVQGAILPKENTVTKAIELMKDTYQIKEFFHVIINKRIPMQAGLAGGSADCAAVMKAINQLCQLYRPIEELMKLSLTIGADVPFCIQEKPSVVKGIGDVVIPFEMHCPFEVLLVKPKQGVSTPLAFKELQLHLCEHSNIIEMRKALENNNYEEMITHVKNSLEESAFRLVPKIAEIKKELLEFGFDVSLMSGSGSCVFALTRNKELIQKALTDLNYDFVEVTTVYMEE